jgi:hypothetical protein
MNVRVRHSAAFVPARAGLFGLVPTLELITMEKPLGELPSVVSRKGVRAEQQRQVLPFLVSVYTGGQLELDRLTPATPETAPELALAYWGPEDATPLRTARVTPLRAVQVFDALEMLGFWEPLHAAEQALAPRRAEATLQAKLQAGPGQAHSEALPVVQVSVFESTVPGLAQGTELALRWRDVDMPEVPVYRGGFADYFIAQMERLGVRVERVPGVLPARAEQPLFAADGSLNPQHEAFGRRPDSDSEPAHAATAPR